MNIDAIADFQARGGESESIRQMIAAQSQKANALMQQRVDFGLEASRELARREIEALNFQVERGMANELGSRTLNKMFGSFSLIQKIMQNMG